MNNKNKKNSFFTKAELKKANPYELHKHYTSFDEWLAQELTVKTNADGSYKMKYANRYELDENGNYIQPQVLDIHHGVELWMICLTKLIDWSIVFAKNEIANKREPKVFEYYGSYRSLRNAILKACPRDLRGQLTQSITVRTISTSMKRLAASGFIKIEYDPNFIGKTRDEKAAMNAQGRHFRKITINYDKIIELSNFEFEKHNKTNVWTSYHDRSREHRWLKKRPYSSLNPILKDLSDKKKKREFAEKLARLHLKLKTAQDVFKAYILFVQNRYTKSEDLTQNLTALKFTEMDEVKAAMAYDSSDAISPYQQAMLNDFINRIQ